jgi:quercetin dioxygenase-like cupin family protein
MNQNSNVKILKDCIGKAQELVKLIDYSDDSVVSKIIIQKSVGSVTLFAFDTGQGLSEHTSPYDAVVQILDGSAKLTIGGEDMTADSGQIVIMPANVPHSVTADERFKMLLIMIRSEK